MTMRQRIRITSGLATGLATALVVALLASTPAPAHAAPPRIDPGFGDGGIARSPLAPFFDFQGFTEVAATADGGIVVDSGGYGSQVVQRYGPDGTPAEPEAKQAGDVATLQPAEATMSDGGRVVGLPKGLGETEIGGKVIRYGADGSLQGSFGSGGVVSTLPLTPEAVAALPSGKVLVAGAGIYSAVGVKSPQVNQMILARLDADGSLDDSFGAKGLVSLRARFEVSDLKALHVQPLGSEGAEVVTPSAIVGLTAAGDLDPGFGKGGLVSNYGQVVGAGAAVGGRVLVAGTKPPGPPPKLGTPYRQEGPGPRSFYVARYDAAGNLDPEFGVAGIATLDPAGARSVGASSAMFEADGSTVIGGSVTPQVPGCPLDYSCDDAPSLVRFTASGVPDPGFGQGGVLSLTALARLTGSGYLTGTRALAPRPGGGILAAGESQQAAFVAAIGSDGALDGSFGQGGIVTEAETLTPFSTPVATGVDAAGNIYVAARTSSGGTYGNAAVLRYTPSGQLDPTYGEGGKAYVASGARALAVAPDGTAFTVTHETGPEPTLTKVDPSGKLDPSFGQNGTAFFPFPRYDYRPEAVLRLADGKVLVAGNLSVKRTSRPALVRFLPDGEPDPSFGKGGAAVLRPGRERGWYAHTIAIDGKGGIIVGGSAQPRHRHHTEDAALIRLRADGAIDPSFGRSGSVLFEPGHLSEAGRLASRGDHIVALTFSTGKGSGGDELFSFGPSGRPDRGFGNRGSTRVALPGLKKGTEKSESDLGLFSTGGQILVARSASILAFSPAGKLLPATSRPLPDLLPNRQTQDIEWGPSAALDGDALIVAWTAFPPEHVGHGLQGEVNLRRLLLH
jgi:uncharacterized delta-60 repeat protein